MRPLTALLIVLCACGSYVPCDAGSRLATVCTQCGVAGGCAKREERCARLCSTPAECRAGEACLTGVCEPAGCI